MVIEILLRTPWVFVAFIWASSAGVDLCHLGALIAFCTCTVSKAESFCLTSLVGIDPQPCEREKNPKIDSTRPTGSPKPGPK